MTKVIDWINNYNGAVAPNDMDLGVEIEVEGKNLPSRVSPNWRVDRDGSLRGEESYEYVTIPIKIDQLDSVIGELETAYKVSKSRVDESIRAGVHVHLNVQEKTPVELFTMVTGYFLLEDLLVAWCGDSREGNHFCMRSKDAEYVLYKLQEVASSGKISHLDTDTIRYCSLNLFSLFKYGTIEFRAMRGTANLEAIKTWTHMLYSIYKNSTRYTDPIDMIMSMSGNGEDSVLHNLLPDHANQVKIVGYEGLIRDSARRLQLVAHATNWSRFQPKMSDRPAPRIERVVGVGAQPAIGVVPGGVVSVEVGNRDVAWRAGILNDFQRLQRAVLDMPPDIWNIPEPARQRGVRIPRVPEPAPVVMDIEVDEAPLPDPVDWFGVPDDE